MKKLFMTLLLSVALVVGISAQQTQSDGTINISIESTRVIGNQILVSGKMSVNSETRFMNLTTNIVTPDGDQHMITKFWWAGEPTYLSSFDITMYPNIPYSFDAAFDSNNKDIKQLTALIFELFNHKAQKKVRISFPNVPVPSSTDPNLANGSIEIDKDVYLKWTKFEETPKGLKIHFVILNKAKKDKIIAFRSYVDGSTVIIDKDGNQYKKCNQTLKDRITFPVNVPVAGYFDTEEPLKMNYVNMLQFQTDWTTQTFTSFSFQK